MGLSGNYYYRDGDEECYKISEHREYMNKNNIKVLRVYRARAIKKATEFYCKHFKGVFLTGKCGKSCDAYNPNNGFNGICRSFKQLFERTDEVLILRHK